MLADADLLVALDLVGDAGALRALGANHLDLAGGAEGESAARQADSQLDLAAPALREGNLVSLTEELSALAETLFPDSAEVAKKKKRIPAAAAKMFDRAKSVILEKTTKKELQHGKDI